MIAVTVYHNVDDHAFFGHEPAHPLVRVFTYDAPTVQGVLETAFEAFNVGEDDLAQRYRKRELRSLSVGDVLTVGDAHWRCASFGWTLITAADMRVVTGDKAERLIRQRYRMRRDEPLAITVPLPEPIDRAHFARTAPRWNCVDFPGEGMHLRPRHAQPCEWCGLWPDDGDES